MTRATGVAHVRLVPRVGGLRASGVITTPGVMIDAPRSKPVAVTFFYGRIVCPVHRLIVFL
jgi:hypothetical protein